MTVRRTERVSTFFPWELKSFLVTFEEFLLQLGLCDFNFHSFVDLLVVSAPMVCIVLDGGGEKSVDECRLAQAGFASNLLGGQYKQGGLDRITNHYGKGGTAFRNNLVPT